MAYRLMEIDSDRTAELLEAASRINYHTSKADINGICMELLTENRDYVSMWEDNFYHMSDHVRPHARIYCMNDADTDLHAEYDVSARTMFLFNFDYYGWVKSIALGMVGNILETAHGIHSVHGAAIDIDGTGVTLIAPSKTGKTTQSWGLLRMDNAHLISDDWYFVTLGKTRPRIRGSEKNCYIDADIGDVWEEYKPLVKEVRFDNKGRGIGNIRWISGQDSVITNASMRFVILLKREQDDERRSYRMTSGEALDYLKTHDFCNPHQLVRDDRSIASRCAFFTEFLSRCEVYMVNTTGQARETQEIIRSIVAGGASVEEA